MLYDEIRAASIAAGYPATDDYHGDHTEGFQRSEFLLQHGFLDAVVKRSELKDYISQAFDFFCI